MGKLRGGSGWVRVSAVLLIASPLAIIWNRPNPLAGPTMVEAAAISGTPKETERAKRCGSMEWPSPRNCDTNQATLRIITPTTTKIPPEALRAAEAQVALQTEELMKNARSNRRAGKPLPAILSHASAKPRKAHAQSYARPTLVEKRQVGITMLGYGY